MMIEFVSFIFEERLNEFELVTRHVRDGLYRFSVIGVVGVTQRVAIDRHRAGDRVRILPTTEIWMKAESAEASAERAHSTEGSASQMSARRTAMCTASAAMSTSNHFSQPLLGNLVLNLTSVACACLVN